MSLITNQGIDLETVTGAIPDITEMDAYRGVDLKHPAQHAASVLLQVMGTILFFGKDLERNFPICVNLQTPLSGLAQVMVTDTLLSKGYQPEVVRLTIETDGIEMEVLRVTRKEHHIPPQ